MIKEKSKSVDGFWDVKAQEEAARTHFDNQIEACERARNLCKRLTGLASNPGYGDMIAAMDELEIHANQMLLTADKPEEMWRLQGRVNALRDIKGLMQNTENRILDLDSQLKVLQDQRSAIFRPDGKVDTGVDLNGIS